MDNNTFYRQQPDITHKYFEFCSSRSGEVIANTIAKCFNNWGLNNVLSVIDDNVTSNDRGIENIIMRLRLRNDLVLNGCHFHTRCSAHVMNLVVK